MADNEIVIGSLIINAFVVAGSLWVNHKNNMRIKTAESGIAHQERLVKKRFEIYEETEKTLLIMSKRKTSGDQFPVLEFLLSKENFEEAHARFDQVLYDRFWLREQSQGILSEILHQMHCLIKVINEMSPETREEWTQISIEFTPRIHGRAQALRESIQEDFYHLHDSTVSLMQFHFMPEFLEESKLGFASKVWAYLSKVPLWLVIAPPSARQYFLEKKQLEAHSPKTPLPKDR